LQDPQPPDAVSAMKVTLYHCGVDPVEFAGRRWVVSDPPFDATNAPEEFTGEGSFEVLSHDRARFVDVSGIELTFRARDRYQRPPCD
jgi:hypothetical protein